MFDPFQLYIGDQDYSIFIIDVLCTTSRSSNSTALANNPFVVTLENTEFRLWTSDLKSIMTYSSSEQPAALFLEPADVANPPTATNYKFRILVKAGKEPAGAPLRVDDFISLTSRSNDNSLLRCYREGPPGFRILMGKNPSDIMYEMNVAVTG